MSEISSTAGALGVVSELASRLADAGVSYCHWKSNESIDRSLSGENDLDLLVVRADRTRFLTVLMSMGAVQAVSRRLVVPGIEDYLLMDDATGRIVHVQPHFELIVGDDMTKSFRLPVEHLMMAGVTDCGLPVPAPEIEYLVFLLRMAIKHCPPETLVARKGRLTGTERSELDWLESRIRSDVIDDARAAAFPHIEASLWQDLRRALEPNASFIDRGRSGRAVLKAVEADGRRSLPSDLVLKMWRRVRLRRIPTSKKLVGGGVIVGVVGGDGSGKSTLVAAISEQFDSVLDVRKVHLGKPPRGLLTRVVRRIFRPVRDRGRLAETRAPMWTRFDAHPGVVFSLWHWLVARDRLRAYRRMRRSAGSGALLVTDRYPLPALRSMDCPRLQELPAGGRVAERLARSEAAMYRRIGRPDLLLVVRVPPSVAVGRRPEQDRDFVERRAQEIWDLDWNQIGGQVLDGTVPQPALASLAINHVWSVL